MAATTFCDLKNGRIFDIVPGCSESEPAAFLGRLQGREKVKMVCIDLLRLEHQTAKACRHYLTRLLCLIEELRPSGFVSLDRLASTFHSWSDALVTMWRFTKNNGITEGFHRKMNLIQHRAYGFRNFHNYRLRLIAQCN